MKIKHLLDQDATDNHWRTTISHFGLKKINADKKGIEWVKRQPELVEKIRQWILLGYMQEEGLFYYNFLCFMTLEHHIPFELPWEKQCVICKKIWPSLIKWNYSCPFTHIEIDVREIVLVAFMVASKLTVEGLEW